jgi:hypothetical protein
VQPFWNYLSSQVVQLQGCYQFLLLNGAGHKVMIKALCFKEIGIDLLFPDTRMVPKVNKRSNHHINFGYTPSNSTLRSYDGHSAGLPNLPSWMGPKATYLPSSRFQSLQKNWPPLVLFHQHFLALKFFC